MDIIIFIQKQRIKHKWKLLSLQELN